MSNFSPQVKHSYEILWILREIVNESIELLNTGEG